jgi:DNA-binding CsgD family transcriptional regulator
MRVIALINDPRVIEKILRHLGAWHDPPPRSPPQRVPGPYAYEPCDDAEVSNLGWIEHPASALIKELGTLRGHSNVVFAAGATGYLLKQTPRAELLSALEDVYRGGSPMTSNIARKVVQSFKQTALPGGTEDLSHREQEVLDLLARGFLYQEIAEQLNISVPTVNTYVRRMYEKLHVRSRAQAVAKYTHLAEAEPRPPLAPRA